LITAVISTALKRWESEGLHTAGDNEVK